MNFVSLSRLAAAAGMASVTAAASAQYPAEVTLPLGSSYSTGQAYSQYGDVSGAGTVYDAHGGAYVGAYGYGATPPRNTVDRIPVQYLRYYPGVWYGLPGSTLPVVAPQVHMPTDTTQLGFYYQRVPTWVPVPGMVPPSPIAGGQYGYGTAAGATTDGSSVNGTNERVISVRPISSGSRTPTHSASGSTVTPPGVIPVPPAPSGSPLPLQPPTAPAAEPNAFIPPSQLEDLPTIQSLFPVSIEE
ncbi:MAG: hypothetical protein H0T47_09695 [Planctomycetaceae bacterium]|nr:hypothetical protein [Planctomycetaceae bacterium]